MSQLKNEFSWSFSRERTWQKCRRMYYFQYYGSWGGWSEDSGERTRRIYVLKQLKNRQMWVGNKVHESIESIVKQIRGGAERIDQEKYKQDLLETMRRDFRSSQQKTYLLSPKTCALFEHEYELDIPDSEWKSTADHAVHCLKTFFSSEIFLSLFQLSTEDWLEVERFSSFLLDDVKIFVIPDLAVRLKEEVLIYDWKTGRKTSEESHLQLAAYGLYASQKWGVSPEHIRTIEVSLTSGDRKEGRMSSASMEDTVSHIRSSIRAMKTLLENEDANSAREDRFPFTENDNDCSQCNFRKVCPRWN